MKITLSSYFTSIPIKKGSFTDLPGPIKLTRYTQNFLSLINFSFHCDIWNLFTNCLHMIYYKIPNPDEDAFIIPAKQLCVNENF